MTDLDVDPLWTVMASAERAKPKSGALSYMVVVTTAEIEDSSGEDSTRPAVMLWEPSDSVAIASVALPEESTVDFPSAVLPSKKTTVFPAVDPEAALVAALKVTDA